MSGSLFSLAKEIPTPILVVGSGGFVGANLFSTLLGLDVEVVGVSTSAGNWRSKIFGFPPFRLSARPSDIGVLLDELQPRTIFNLAAYGAYPIQEKFELMVERNILLVKSLADWSERNGTSLIHTGSSSEFGVNCNAPAASTVPLPNSAYAVTKLAASNWIEHRCRDGELHATVLRLYSVYGPGEDSSRLMPQLALSALKNVFPPFGDRGTSRDFVYVDDVVEALLRAAICCREGARGKCISIGTGVSTTLEDLAKLAGQVFEIRDEPIFGSPLRKWDLTNWRANIQDAEQLLNWQARTSLAEGLVQSGRWWSEFGEFSESSLECGEDYSGAQPPEVSVVVACYRDRQAVPVLYERATTTLRAMGIEYEIIFANDNCPDDSQSAIEELAARDSHVRGIKHSRNFGSQAAFLSGMQLSSGRYVVLMDGDLQDPPELIRDLYAKTLEGFDVVYGRRVEREASWLMQRAYKAFYWVFSYVSPFEIPRDAGDFSIMSREVVSAILAMPEQDLFLRAQRAYVGFSQVGVDYKRPERQFGRTTNSFRRNLGWATRGVLAVSRAPLTLMSVVALALFIVSLGAIAIQALAKLSGLGDAPRGWVSIWSLVLGIGAVNLLAISIVGEYVGRILEEVKRRPRFIRSKTIGFGEARNGISDRDRD